MPLDQSSKQHQTSKDIIKLDSILQDKLYSTFFAIASVIMHLDRKIISVIRDKSFWDVPIPSSASWRRQGILAIRVQASPSMSFWTDCWLDGGNLIDQFGD